MLIFIYASIATAILGFGLALLPAWKQTLEKDSAMNYKKILNLTVNPVELVRILLSDPVTREMVWTAIRSGPMPSERPLGYGNFAPEGGPELWYSLFLGTRRNAQPNTQGYVALTNNGDRVFLRAQKQEKEHNAASPTAVQNINAQAAIGKIQQALINGDSEAAKSILAAYQTTQTPGQVLPPQPKAVSTTATKPAAAETELFEENLQHLFE